MTKTREQENKLFLLVCGWAAPYVRPTKKKSAAGQEIVVKMMGVKYMS